LFAKRQLRWRDVARPDDEALANRLNDVLGEHLSVAPRPDQLFGDPVPPTRYRIKIVVEDVKLRLCLPGLGIGEKQPSGEGTVLVRWDTYNRAARSKQASEIFAVPIVLNKRDARGAAGVLGDAVAASAMRYAASRTP
jgi:hypothetical protein